MHIDSAFDGGNIEVLDASRADDVRLAIRRDRYSRYYQWFAFRVVGARGKACTFRIVNAGGAAYLQAGATAIAPPRRATGSTGTGSRRATTARR